MTPEPRHPTLEGVSVHRLGSSPLGVVALSFSAVFVWTCAYETAADSIPAAAERTAGAEQGGAAEPGAHAEPAEAIAEGAADQVAASEAAPAAPAERSGPRLRYEPDLTVEPFGLPIAIEDLDGTSMDAFHAALGRAGRGEGKARAVFYGASHVASDTFTHLIRESLQDRYGDGGQGFVLPVHAWRSYHRRGVEIESNRNQWSAVRIRASSQEVGRFGLAGVYVETERAGAFGSLRPLERHDRGGKVGSFDLYYLKQPEGGSFDVLIDGRRAQRVMTAAEVEEPAYATFEVEDGPHRLEIRTQGTGKVRVFGVAMERERPGFVLDTLGLNGARVRSHLLWEDSLYREHLRRRDPDLVVLAYGTNESGDDEVPIDVYTDRLREVVGRIRETVPRASCLLIGPSDRPMRVDGAFQDRPRTSAIVEAQYRVSLEMGCGFFDLVAFQGGPLSMIELAVADPPYAAPDHIHYTRRGYARLGEMLLGALLEGAPEPGTRISAQAAAAQGVGAPPGELVEAIVNEGPERTYEDD